MKAKISCFISRLLIVMLICIIVWPVLQVDSEAELTTKRILYINSYHPGFETFFQQIEGLKTSFSDENQSDFIIDLDIEFMDTKRLNTSENINNFKETLEYKLQNVEAYDLIIVADDNGYDFVVENQEEYFADLPIVFLGLNGVDKAEAALDNDLITGVVEAISIDMTVKMAINLSEEKHLVIIVDNKQSGQHDLELFEEYYTSDLNKLDFTYEVINLSEYNAEGFSKELIKLNPLEPILLLSAYELKDGITLSFDEGLGIITSAFSGPIYHPYQHGIGEGILGGKVISHYQQGLTAGNLALQILKSPEKELPQVIFNSPNSIMLDRELFKSFGYNITSLEKIIGLERIIWVNDNETTLAEYVSILLPILLFLLIQGFLVYISIKTIKANQKAENQLMINHRELEANHATLVDKDQALRKQYGELLNYKQKLEDSRSRYIMAFKASGGGIWDEDFSTGEVYIKESWYEKYIDIALIKNQLSDWYDCIVEEDKPHYNEVRFNALNSKSNIYECEYKIYSPLQKKLIWIHENGFILRDVDDKIIRIVGGHQDITNKKLQEEKIKELVYIDGLTALANKLSLLDKLEELCTNGNEQMHSIILIDIDNFKNVNDTFGHDVGDKLLKQVGERLSKYSNSNTTIGRFGGDEFIVIVENIHCDQEIEDLLLSLKRIFAKEYIVNLNKFQLTSSSGVAKYPEHGKTSASLLKAADLAMYQSKELGKNMHTYYHEKMFVELEEKLVFNRELYHGLINGEFYLEYQPIIKASDKSVYGFEALIRWKSKKYGQVSPVKIIAEAESNGLIHEIGLWVFREAIKTLKSLNRYYNNKFKMSINLSAIQFNRSDILSRFNEFINQMEVNSSNVVLEVTETALIENFDACVSSLEEFKNMGMKIALDDFGTGYSSLSYFKQLPIDYIKVDKTFVDQMAIHKYDKMIIEVMEKIAHNRNMLIVAEGVEKEDQFNHIVNANYDLIQGYFFSKPLNEDDLLVYLDSLE